METSALRQAVITELTTERDAAQARFQSYEADLGNLDQRDFERCFYTVRISDPWDSTYPGGFIGSGSVTGRGLQATIDHAEREYQRRSGSSLRTDGVLAFYVTLHLDHADIPIPQAVWESMTTQGREAMAADLTPV